MSTHRSPHGVPPHPTAVADLLESGVPRWLLYGSGREHPIHGVVMASGSLTPREKRIAALRLKLSPGQFFSRRTAAALHGIPIDDLRLTDKIELGSVRSAGTSRRAQITAHQLRDGVLERIPTSPGWLPTVEDAWCLLAQVASKPELLAAGDFLVSGSSRYAEPQSTLGELARAVQRFAGCSGGRLRTETLPLMRTGVESPAESRLRLIIVESGLPEPRTCCPVQTRGRLLHSDLGYSAWKIGIEYEGAYHFDHGSIDQSRRDVSRIRAMEDVGWKILRATAHDLRAPRDFLSQLASAIRDRGGSAALPAMLR